MSLERLYLSQIRTDGGTQPRGALNEETVIEYAAAMANPAVEFPPVRVVFDGESYWLYDGFHRVAAAAEAGWSQFNAEVLQGTLQDAQWLSFGANQTHGLRRTNADKRRAVEAALRHERGMTMSDNAIAEHCGVSHPFVGSVRRDLTNNGFQSKEVQIPTCNGYKSEIEAGAAAPELRIGRDGRAINVANIGATVKSADEWPESDGEFFPDDDVVREVCWSGPQGAWMAIEKLQVGPEAWVARFEFEALPLGHTEPLYSDPIHNRAEDAIADAALRGGIYLDNLAEAGKLPKSKQELARLRWIRWKFADNAGQATLDLDIWDEPQAEPAPALTPAQKLKKDPRLAVMEEAVRCVLFLSGTTDWRALGMLAAHGHDGAALLGNVNYAKRNLSHFAKGIEAR